MTLVRGRNDVEMNVQARQHGRGGVENGRVDDTYQIRGQIQ